jgi:hypothetical protein
MASPVGIGTDYYFESRRSIRDRSKRFLSSPQRPERLWGPPGLLSSGYQGPFREVKGQGRGNGHLFPSSAEVTNG